MEAKPSNNDKPGSTRPYCGAMGRTHLHVFMPQPGITPDELAKSVELVSLGIGVMVRAAKPEACDLVYADMDEETRRHWKLLELPKVATAQRQPPKLQLPPGMNRGGLLGGKG